MQPVRKSAKLANVCYDIRGPVLARAKPTVGQDRNNPAGRIVDPQSHRAGAGQAEADQPAAAHGMRCAKRSTPPFRLSCHTTMTPPALSLTSRGSY